MIDPRMSRGRDLGFGMIGNAETRRFEHRKIIGAIANRKSLLGGEAMRFRAIASNAASLASLPRMGSATRPLSLPFSPKRSSFARCS